MPPRRLSNVSASIALRWYGQILVSSATFSSVIPRRRRSVRSASPIEAIACKHSQPLCGYCLGFAGQLTGLNKCRSLAAAIRQGDEGKAEGVAADVNNVSRGIFGGGSA